MSNSSPVFTTERLALHHFTLDDAPLALELVNDPAFLRYIGDRGVRTLDDARAYLSNGPLASYARHGFGLFKVVSLSSGEPVGMCGLLKRDTLEDVDAGYAFLPAFRAQGYASEALAGLIDYARRVHDLRRLVAIVQPDNAASIRVLQRTGFAFERSIQMSADSKPLDLFGRAT